VATAALPLYCANPAIGIAMQKIEKIKNRLFFISTSLFCAVSVASMRESCSKPPAISAIPPRLELAPFIKKNSL
jgi:hypothetical protein